MDSRMKLPLNPDGQWIFHANFIWAGGGGFIFLSADGKKVRDRFQCMRMGMVYIGWGVRRFLSF
jgi:hypothetical protein